MSQETARDHWRALYRAARVARREALKAMEDMLIYGTGVVVVRPDGEVAHVPLATLWEPTGRSMWEDIIQSGNHIDS